MNITRKDVDPLNVIITLQVGKEDYEPKVETTLKEYRRKAKIDGFRPGMVPIGLIKKMYGKAVLFEEINKLISESISKYIHENKLHVLGDPLPSENEQKEIDWDQQTEFEFSFDLAIAPVIDLTLSEKDKIPYFDILVDEKQISSYFEYYLKRYGSYVDTDTAASEEMIKGNLTELDHEGKDTANKIENTALTISSVKEDEIKKLFLGKKKGDTVTFNPVAAFPEDSDLAVLFRTTKEKLKKTENNFRMEITGISKFEPAVPGQDLYDKIYGKDKVTNEEDFRLKIKEEIKKNYENESFYKFRLDAHACLLEKTALSLPDAALKRWLLLTNKSELTPEQIESQYPHFAEDLKWQLIKGHIAQTNQITVTDEDVLELAKVLTVQQFQQYGLNGLPDENITSYAKKMLEKEEDKHRLQEKKQEDKVLEFVKHSVNLDVKEITPDDFNKMFATEQEHDHDHEHEHEHEHEHNHEHDHKH
jgi:trigger factor